MLRKAGDLDPFCSNQQVLELQMNTD